MPQREPSGEVAGPVKDLGPDEAEAIATLTYTFGYPLVLMDVTRQFMTAVPAVEAHHAPMNQMMHMAAFPDPSIHDVVSPNVDTLYSAAWLDLGREPMVLRTPGMGERFYMMQMLDAWTNVFASPGTRTTGNDAASFALVGPHWEGELPDGLQVLPAPTEIVWLVGRTFTAGKADYASVHEVQHRYELLPLGQLGKRYAPPVNLPVDPTIDTSTPPVEQVRKMNAGQFLGRLATLLTRNPASPDDAPLLHRMRRIGVTPGAKVDLGRAPFKIADAIARGVAAARERIAEGAKSGGKLVNGWRVDTDVGRYGTDYDLRAQVACFELGANLPEDAVYMAASVDDKGRPLTGKHRYVIRFPPAEEPPVNAFWSVTMYGADHFLVDNPISRYALGDRDDLRPNPDDSLDLAVQHARPEPAKESNWLPAPAGDFNLILRLYWPQSSILDGSWTPPAIVRVA